MTPPTTVDKPTGRTTFDPGSQVPTEFVPAGGLTPTGRWVPLLATEQGTLLVETDATIATMPHFDDVQVDTDPGVEQTLIDVTVPAGKIRSLVAVEVVTRVTGSFGVYANNVLIGSGRTGPGEFGTMYYSVPRPLVGGTEYQVIFKSRLNSPVQSVECYVQASDMTA